jgi:hypothetical protein
VRAVVGARPLVALVAQDAGALGGQLDAGALADAEALQHLVHPGAADLLRGHDRPDVARLDEHAGERSSARPGAGGCR